MHKVVLPSQLEPKLLNGLRFVFFRGAGGETNLSSGGA